MSAARIATIGIASWTTNSASIITESRRLRRSVTSTATARSACPIVSMTSTCSRPRSGSGPVPAPAAKAMGSEPSASVHWLTAEDSSTATPWAARSCVTSTNAITSSGLSVASGTSHWTSRYGLMPDRRARAKHGVGERLSGDENGERGVDHDPHDPPPAKPLRELAQLRRHADEVRRLGGAGGEATQVQDVEPDQNDGVGPGQVTAQDDHGGIQGGGGDDRQVDASLRLEVHELQTPSSATSEHHRGNRRHPDRASSGAVGWRR